MLSNRANAICLLRVLHGFSDEKHILPMREIIAKLKQDYDIEIDWRTIYSTIEMLQHLGYDISTYEENSVGYYLRSRIVEPSELNLLMDAVYSFPFISAKQSTELIAKLKNIGSIYQGKKYRYLSVIRADRKTSNKQVFLNIDLLDEAIEQKKQVGFTYLTYNEKKQLVPRRTELYIVNPYRMIYTNEHYYLVCNLSGYEKVSLYRIDRMRDISILDSKAVYKADEAEKATQNAIYAFAGAPEKITFAFDKAVLNDILDRFGTDIKITKENDRDIARITASPRGVKFWALQYLPYVEVLEPVWLRDEIIESIQKNRYLTAE